MGINLSSCYGTVTEDLLHDLLASLLEMPYNSIQRIDVLPEISVGKFSRMDLKLLVDNRLIYR